MILPEAKETIRVKSLRPDTSVNGGFDLPTSRVVKIGILKQRVSPLSGTQSCTAYCFNGTETAQSITPRIFSLYYLIFILPLTLPKSSVRNLHRPYIPDQRLHPLDPTQV